MDCVAVGVASLMVVGDGGTSVALAVASLTDVAVSVGAGVAVSVETGVGLSIGVAVSVGSRVFVAVVWLTGVLVDIWATLSEVGVFSGPTITATLVGVVEAVAAMSFLVGP